MREINALELRKKLNEIMDWVQSHKEPFLIKKSGRPIVVLLDIEVYKTSQEHFQEEAFIEQYSEERIAEFLGEDKIDRKLSRDVRRTFKM